MIGVQGFRNMTIMARNGKDSWSGRTRKDSGRESIHSGHFMISDFEAEAQDDEDELAVPVPEVAEPKAVIPYRRPLLNTKPTFSSAKPSANLLSIETSLSKLFQCMSIAYRQKLTSPKWNRFKGVRLRWKDKIRLNNVIWRCWHMQFIKQQKTLVCQFASPLDVDTHNKPEAIVLEGKYWKRKLHAVTAEYKKWRMFTHNQILGRPEKYGQDLLAEFESGEWQAQPSDSAMMVDEDYMNLMSDTLFSAITGNVPFHFPDTREIARGTNIADFIQPSLVQLQPSLEEFMDIEPLNELLCTRLTSVPEEGAGVSQPLTATEAVAPGGGSARAESQGLLEGYDPSGGAFPMWYIPPGGSGYQQAQPVYQPAPPPPPPPAPAPPQMHQVITHPPKPRLKGRQRSSGSLNKKLVSSLSSGSLPAETSTAKLNQPIAPGVISGQTQSQAQSSSALLEQLLTSKNGGVRLIMELCRATSDNLPAVSFEMTLENSSLHSSSDIGERKPGGSGTLYHFLESSPDGSGVAKMSSSSNYSPHQAIQHSSQVQQVQQIQQAQQIQSEVRPYLSSAFDPLDSSSLIDSGQMVYQRQQSIIRSPEHSYNTNENSCSQLSPSPSEASPTKATLHSPIPSLQSQVIGGSCPGSPVTSQEQLSLSPLNVASPSSPKPPKGYKEHRRVCHINAEQKRRCNIKNGFDTLHSLIPQLHQNPNTKMSKAAMLQKGADYIVQLRNERATLKQEMEVLKQQIENLNATISNCQAMLPVTGVPISRQRSNKMKDMFKQYVRARTIENWKFWILSLIFEPLLESFNNFVSTNSLQDLYRTTLQWVDQHCSLIDLRPVVLNALRQLCMTTDVLQEPGRLPLEAREAVEKGFKKNNH